MPRLSGPGASLGWMTFEPQVLQSPITATRVLSIASLVGKLPVKKAMYSQKWITGMLVFRPVDLDAFP